MAITADDLGAVAWRKSSYSNGSGGDCVEAADGHSGVIPVRDSKVSDSQARCFSSGPPPGRPSSPP